MFKRGIGICTTSFYKFCSVYICAHFKNDNCSLIDLIVAFTYLLFIYSFYSAENILFQARKLEKYWFLISFSVPETLYSSSSLLSVHYSHISERCSAQCGREASINTLQFIGAPEYLTLFSVYSMFTLCLSNTG